MTVFEIIDAFTFYGLDVIALAIATCLTVQLLKITLFKRCQKKIAAFLPFTVGTLFYAAYAAAVHLSLKYVITEYVTVLEHGFSVGALSTVVYVLYEQFVRNRQKAGVTESVIATLIEGYVPDGQTEEVAAKIAKTIARDVTGDGAKKTADILTAAANGEQVTENDIKMLSRLIIETLAHITAT